MTTESPSGAEPRSVPYGGLRSKITIVIVIVSLAPMLLVSGVTLFQFDSFANEMVHAHLGELVLKHRQNIDRLAQVAPGGIRFRIRGPGAHR
jgi:two-component system NtrC family sensor kinase